MIKRIGRYEVIAELGRGGFGMVFRGFDPTLGSPVAIKTLTSDGDAGMLTRFRNEAAASRRLNHPNIITIYDFGEHEGSPFIVMELLEGQDLHRVIESRTPLSLLHKLKVMIQIAAGLRHAHIHGVIHRDVKPANVMLLLDGSVKMMDFGIALITQSTHSRLTPRGAMIGTFRYMAPEQFRGAEPDARSDIFAFGLIFYELLSGVHPFHAADAAALMYNIMSVEPVSIGELVPDCPKELRAVIEKLLSKDPEGRYQSLDDVLFDIEPPLLELRRERALELLKEAQAAMAEKRFESAQELVRQILELTPGDEEARRLREEIQIALRRQAIRPRVEDLIRKGRDSLAAGNATDAVQSFESALRLDATTPEIQALLQEARAAVERSREASRLALEAENVFKHGDPAGAARLARQALELASAEPVAVRVLSASESALAEERRKARLSEDLARARRLIDMRSWNEASVLLAKIDKEFSGVVEIGVLAERLRVGWAREERDRLLASGLAAARQQFQQGNLVGAHATLVELAAQYPESTDVETMLGFVRLEIEGQNRRDFVKGNIENARVAAARRELESAANVLDAALSRYPSDPDLQHERRSVAAEQREAARRLAAETAIASAAGFRSQGRLSDALRSLDEFLAAHGADPAVVDLREAIVKEQDTARRAAELREFVHRARDLLARGRAAEATTLLLEPPSHLRDKSEVHQLLDEAKLQLRQQAERKAALDGALTEIFRLCEEGSFREGIRLLDAFQAKYGPDDEVNQARRRVEEAEQDAHNAAADLLARATGLLARDPVGATALFHAAPAHLRQRAEIQNLERAAAVAVEEQRVREAVTKLLRAAKELYIAGDFTEALTLLDKGITQYSGRPQLIAARREVLSAQQKYERERIHQKTIDKIRALITSHRYEEAATVLAGPLARDPADEELVRLRAAVEAGQAQQVPKTIERAPSAPTKGKSLPWKWIGIGVAFVLIVMFASRLLHKTAVVLIPVEVRTDPQGASVKVGDRLCVTPNCRFELSPGEYSVDARLNGYRPAQQILDVKPNEPPGMLNLKLEPIPVAPPPGPASVSSGTGTLAIETDQDGVRVIVNGKPYLSRNERRVVIPLAPDTYSVVVEKAGFQSPPTQQATVRRDQFTRLSMTLKPLVDERELQAWNQARSSGDVGALERYLQTYPAGAHSNEARPLVEQLRAEAAARDKVVRDQAAQKQAALEQAAREKAAREKADREKTEREQAARDKAARDQAARDQAAREKADREKADLDKAAREKTERDKVDREREQARAADTSAILATLDRYKSAYSTKNANTLRAVWPSIPRETLSAISRAFSHGKTFDVDLRFVGQPAIERDTAVATCVRTVTEDGRKTPDRVRFHLQKMGTAWVIVNID